MATVVLIKLIYTKSVPSLWVHCFIKSSFRAGM